MRKIQLLLGVLVVNLLLTGCFAIQRGDEYTHVAPGAWRFVFKFGEKEAAERIPINLNIKEASEEKGQNNDIFEFGNGNSMTTSDKVQFVGDTAFVYFDGEANYLKILCQPDWMEGYYYHPDKDGYPIEFYAQYGKTHRFMDLRQPPKSDVTGAWAVDVLEKDKEMVPARLDLQASDNKVLATFKMDSTLTQTLEGTIQDDQIKLSAFNGQAVILLEAVLRDSVTLGRGRLRINNRELAIKARKVE